MPILPDLQHITALSFIILAVLAGCMGTMVLYLHRWLCKTAGHPILPPATSRHIP